MTENEAINKIQWRIYIASRIAGKGTDGKAMEDLEMAIQALDEIQSYRAIGTVEELQALKEKSVARKPILNNPKINEFYIKEAKLCPSCHSYINNCSGDYCRDCGQKLDWSE